ncbi:MBL fold metallo-hydrolase [Bradyrhizobium sp. INPA01-394B]|uniref:MBL fold metallo-hydrolase n=1 Tax=Bradyrhizobium campsiandrae TaxID=1729892 RepID=A0ABR7U142_9BRAD|nr:MBL fold metallo-hydrolase [Bradyrhizobium campsiandrae]MBC9877720.1 MBL fold metallo-hydrolase [Bradyrhizobium campsiandrae]MBC9977724.1 MBL fold metallo-hydrolase [Bradyrhizobium campsiandrae]
MGATIGYVDKCNLMSRRRFMAATAGVVASPLLPNRGLATGLHTFGHGAFDIRVCSDGHMVVPASMLAIGAPVDKLAEVLRRTNAPAPMAWPAANIPLIQIGRELVLVDVGDGKNFQPTEGELLSCLRVNGIDPASITKVVLTHAHPDHLWGICNSAGELNYPNATYHVGSAEWNFWMSSDVATSLPADFRGIVPRTQRALAAIADRVTFVKHGDEIVSGMRVLSTPGHTPGQFSLELEGDTGLIITADALTHEVISFEYPEWVNGFDLVSDIAIANRRKLLALVAAERTKLLGFHFKYPGIGHAEKSGSAYRFVAA